MRRKEKKAKRLAVLNPQEDKCWVFAFCYYVDSGETEDQADKFAWRDLQLDFPRFSKYSQCQ